MLIYLQMIEDPADRERFCQLYEAHRNAMYWTAYRILGREADAEDAVQEAFFRLAKNMEKIGEPLCQKTRALAVVIVEHTALDVYRARKKYVGTELMEDFLAAPPEELEERGTLTKALWVLSPRYRQVLLLRFYHGYSNGEIASLLSTTPENVSQLIHRGREKLAQLLRQEGVEV